MSEIQEEFKDTGGPGIMNTEKRAPDAEYIAVLRDIEPAGTAELAEKFDVRLDTARRRLGRLQEEDDSPVEKKKIGGSYVWFVDESELDAGATSAAEEIRRRMGVE